MVSGAAIYLIANILNAAIPFIMLPILTRYLNPAEYGEVAMFQTLLAALAAFTGLSVHAAANRKFYDGNIKEFEMKNFIGSCLQILIVSSSLVFLILFAFRNEFSRWLGLKSEWILIAVFVSAASFIIQIRLGQWQVRNKPKLFGAFQVSRSLLDMILTIVLVVFILYGSVGRIISQSLAIGVFGLFALYLLYKGNLLTFFQWSPVYIKEALMFGVPLMPHIAGVFLLNSVSRFVVNSELGLAQAGIYMVAVQISMAMGIIFDSINKAYVPWLFERLKRNILTEKIQIIKLTYGYFLIVILVAIIVFIFGPYFIVLLAGEDYSQAGEVIGWLALGQAFNGMYLMVTNYIFYSKKTGLLSVVTVFSGFLNVVLLLLLINVFSLQGAAIAYCISMIIRFLLTWFVSHKRHPMPWFNFKTTIIN